MASTTDNRIRRNGMIYQMRKARKGHKCTDCGYPIEPGTNYYEGVGAGSGVSYMVHPDRLHEDCLNLRIGEV